MPWAAPPAVLKRGFCATGALALASVEKHARGRAVFHRKCEAGSPPRIERHGAAWENGVAFREFTRTMPASATPSGALHPEELPVEIIDAVISAARQMAALETWLPERRSGALHLLPRLSSLLEAGSQMTSAGRVARMIRQNALRILAHSSPDIRYVVLLDLAMRKPAVTRDLFTGPVDADYERYRYNLIISLGTLARHGLLAAAMSPERASRVLRAIDRAQRLRGRIVNERKSS